MRGRNSKPESQSDPEIIFEEKQPGALSALIESVIEEVIVPKLVHASGEERPAPAEIGDRRKK